MLLNDRVFRRGLGSFGDKGFLALSGDFPLRAMPRAPDQSALVKW
jgi:hypothetical protein